MNIEVNNNLTIFFLHIPKTAGRSLQYALKRTYNKNQIFITGGSKESLSTLKNYSDKKKKQFRIITGHFPFGLHRYFTQPIKYATTLREPIDRVISLYYYIKKYPDHRLYNKINELELEDFIKNEISTEFNNGQTRQIIGGKNLKFEMYNEEILEEAKNNLINYFDVTGIIERFDETLLLLNKTFNWKLFNIHKNINKYNKPKSSLPESTIATIKKYNLMDIELYKFAESLFEKQLAPYKENIEEEIKKMNSDFSILKTKWKVKEFLKKILNR